ncbi:hypothetical protein OH77DRAFT_87883 [Trametes cingulata]|nr:hypothetical protein OH77DRAFT_87883 [Trametes cingulata]
MRLDNPLRDRQRGSSRRDDSRSSCDLKSLLVSTPAPSASSSGNPQSAPQVPDAEVDATMVHRPAPSASPPPPNAATLPGISVDLPTHVPGRTTGRRPFDDTCAMYPRTEVRPIFTQREARTTAAHWSLDAILDPCFSHCLLAPTLPLAGPSSLRTSPATLGSHC